MQLEDDDFEGGWACEKKHSKNHGRKYIESFKQDIQDMFIAKVTDMSKRLGLGRMLSQLRKNTQIGLTYLVKWKFFKRFKH